VGAGSAVPGPEITVVVPTRDRPDCLKQCLARLAAQNASVEIEVVVVDDGSADAEHVASVVDTLPNARLVRQGRRGPAAARNAGVRAARGFVICLTDDDCEPAPGWVATMAEAVRAGADVVSGETVIAGSRSRLDVASQLVTDAVTHRARTPFAASNNLASTARLLEEIPFDERYSDAAGEDRDWCERVFAHGVRIERRPAGVVHRQNLSLRGYLDRHVRYGRGSYRYHRAQPRRRPLERPDFYARLVGEGFRAGPAVGALVALAQLATAFGYAREAVARRRT
jgi:glycosyltransferase involved in cell wall biosynthesis